MIDQEEIQRILKQEVEGAVGYIDDELSADRIKALEYYLGEKFGNEEEGRSQVVSRDVADTVDHIMPSLMRIFSTTNYVKYAPRTQNDVEAAAQATDLANYVIERAGGFRLLACWMKDALLFKLGVLRPYYDEKTTVVEEIHNGLSAEEYEFLLSGDVEVVEAVERAAVAEQWTLWAMTETEKACLTGLFHSLGIMGREKDPKIVADCMVELERPFKVIDAHLVKNEWLMGGRFTIADLNVASVLAWAKTGQFDLSTYPHLVKWLDTCLARPAYQRVREMQKPAS